MKQGTGNSHPNDEDLSLGAPAGDGEAGTRDRGTRDLGSKGVSN